MYETLDGSQTTKFSFTRFVASVLEKECYQTKDTEANSVIKILETYARLNSKRYCELGWLVKKEFQVTELVSIASWKLTEKYFRFVCKKGRLPNFQGNLEEGELPPFPENFYARGLFTLGSRVVVRGYNKFFEVDSVPTTKWEYLKESTIGPYEVTVKENGCIIFVGYLEEIGLLVTSKHCVRSCNETEEAKEKERHHQVGEKWLHQHLAQANITQAELILFLKEFNVTLVFELCDDSFEEHVFSYQSRAGLYLHGINFNDITLQTWPSSVVQKVAKHFGFHTVEFFSEISLDGVKNLSEKSKGYLNNRPIEGFVIRCKNKNFETIFFKIKFDFPYQLFREWREVTKNILTAYDKGTSFPVIKKPKFPLSTEYFAWVKNKIITERELFRNYLSSQGVVKTRELFLSETGHSIYDKPCPEPYSAPEIVLDTTPKILLVPVSTPGIGKTVLLTTLLKVFNCGYVQNDSYKNKNRFYEAVIQSLEVNNLVLADRNNHLGLLRQELTSTVLSKYPQTSIVSVQWCLSDSTEFSPTEWFAFTYKNVLLRGKHHPSLTALHTPNLEKTMWRFITGFEPLDSSLYPSDSNFSHNISITLDQPLPEQIFKRVLPGLESLPVPPASYNFPSDITIPKIEDMLSQSLFDLGKVECTSKKLKPPASLNRVSIVFGGSLMKCLHKQLFSKEAFKQFPKLPLLKARSFFNQLQSNPTSGLVFSPGYSHVTLFHKEDPKLEFQLVYQNQPGSSWFGVGVQVYFDKLVWHSDKIMALSVSCIRTLDNSPYNSKSKSTIIPIHTTILTCNNPPCNQHLPCSTCLESLPNGIYSCNKHLHVTVGVLDNSVLAKQSNELLEALHSNNKVSPICDGFVWKPQVIRMVPPLVAIGRVRAHGQ